MTVVHGRPPHLQQGRFPSESPLDSSCAKCSQGVPVIALTYLVGPQVAPSYHEPKSRLRP